MVKQMSEFDKNHAMTPSPTPIREYEQAVYVYWLGPNLPTVKIGHTNNPARRLREFINETGTPGHKAAFAAIVWLDRRREAVELAVHRRLRDQRRDGEWFAVSAEDALAAIVAVAECMNIRYEVEDLADLTGAIAHREAEAEAERQRAAIEAAKAERQRRIADALQNGQRLICVNIYQLRRPNGELVLSPEPSFSGRSLEYYNREQAQIAAAEQGCTVEFIGSQDRLVRLSKLNPENLTEIERAAMAEHLAREAAQHDAAEARRRQIHRDKAARVCNFVKIAIRASGSNWQGLANLDTFRNFAYGLSKPLLSELPVDEDLLECFLANHDAFILAVAEQAKHPKLKVREGRRIRELRCNAEARESDIIFANPDASFGTSLFPLAMRILAAGDKAVLSRSRSFWTRILG